MPSTPVITFLNADLDIATRGDPSALITMLDALEVYGINDVLAPDGERRIGFESSSNADPETTVTRLLAAIEALRGEAHAAWTTCTVREIHLGFDCGETPRSLTHTLSSATLARVAGAGMSLRITLYRN